MKVANQCSCDDHTHQDICVRCEELTTVLQEIEELISQMPTHSVSEDTKQELLFVFDKRNITPPLEGAPFAKCEPGRGPPGRP